MGFVTAVETLHKTRNMDTVRQEPITRWLCKIRSGDTGIPQSQRGYVSTPSLSCDMGDMSLLPVSPHQGQFPAPASKEQTLKTKEVVLNHGKQEVSAGSSAEAQGQWDGVRGPVQLSGHRE